MHDKPTLRQHMRERLRAMDEGARAAVDAAIITQVVNFVSAQRRGVTVSLFGGLKNEPELLPRTLDELKEHGVSLTCFEIDAGELRPRLVQSMNDLKRGQMNVWEPRPHCSVVEIATLDIILVPGLAFTRDGRRLGRGGGYFDRLLARPQCKARRIGIAYDLQIVDSIPTEPHDQCVYEIITESGLITTSAPH